MTVRFEIRSLGRWDRPVTRDRRSSGVFRAKWDDTVKLLLNEVELLGGALVVLQVDADPTQIRRDGMLRAHAPVAFPGVKVSFESDHGPLTYATDAYDRWYPAAMPGWQANVRAIALSLGALRDVDRWGVTHTGEQYRGFAAISAKPMEDTLTTESARLVFADALKGAEFSIDDIDLSAKAGVNLAYRQAAKRHHPDVIGGDGSVMRLITKARDTLLASAR